MKFAHIADCHLGAWRYPELQQLGLKAFEIAIDKCIKEKVDFAIIAGDLFDVAMPGVEILKETVSIFKKLKENNIKCFVLAGSHDFSVTGKTFLDVLERADLFKNVFIKNENELEIFEDKELNVSFAGIPGKKAGAEVTMFKNLKIKALPKDLFKIFVFHTLLTESKSKQLASASSISITELPDGFDYYAGGHLHLVMKHKKGNAFVAYPGPLFPTNFEELENLKHGRFFIVDVNEKTKEIKIREEEIKLKDIIVISCNVNSLNPAAATQKILDEIEKHDTKDKIVMLKIYGVLDGRTSDIDFEKIKEKLQHSYCYLKNTSGLTTKEIEIEIETEAEDVETIEQNIIAEYRKNEQSEFILLIDRLIAALNTEKYEGETKEKYETRLVSEFKEIVKEIEKEKKKEK